jgi:diaminohydroxyphosphoribosylaminopyrimidine deaminase/5-amino-6-(5-phosphoribosylamino)uracil reductase
MVGINTIRVDNPSLTTRLKDRQCKDPVRVILDTRLSISPDAKVLRPVSAAETILVAGHPVSKDKKSALEQMGARVLEAPLKNDWIDLELLMERLGGMQLCSLLIEGGSRVLASAFTSRIVDKVYFFYAPKILGGDDGAPICSGPGPDSISDSIAVKDISVRRLGEDVLIEGYIR